MGPKSAWAKSQKISPNFSEMAFVARLGGIEVSDSTETLAEQEERRQLLPTSPQSDVPSVTKKGKIVCNI